MHSASRSLPSVPSLAAMPSTPAKAPLVRVAAADPRGGVRPAAEHRGGLLGRRAPSARFASASSAYRAFSDAHGRSASRASRVALSRSTCSAYRALVDIAFAASAASTAILLRSALSASKAAISVSFTIN